MFELNPLANPDAFWQHILMLAVALILGYIIGYISRKSVISDMEIELSRLDSDLKYCQDQKIVLKSADERVQVNNVREVLPVMPVAEKIQQDDLKVIEGIGPKIESVLKDAGIYSFRQLSQKSAEQISVILANSDSRFQVHDPATWPRQAELAANGDWDRLKTWQDELNGGRVE
ncbi:hypothetical protein SAMN04487995_5878 [Dyadobacter koreensis]|uniref:DUF4332 domain-containing protein n=1 Tax=Dyadobacter koreensis TaxID=408657 RepID=A0A1H7AS97_9BACT|nr:hypothetical protein [Dyadobacter koreensis]SEJ68188.1 hypothetical protein SAMN04487995_5878 [Dyadobacter koreensis]